MTLVRSRADTHPARLLHVADHARNPRGGRRCGGLVPIRIRIRQPIRYPTQAKNGKIMLIGTVRVCKTPTNDERRHSACRWVSMH